MKTDELQRYLAGVLRYFASAVVGVSLVWAFDEKHDVFEKVYSLAWPATAAFSSWALVGLLAVIGLVTYFVHRIAIHWLVTHLILLSLRRSNPAVPSALDLDFARWMRRGAVAPNPQRAVQGALDEINAAAHFLYCSAWASLLVAGYIYRADGEHLNLMPGFTPIVGVLLFLGLVGDIRAARYDVAAYQKFGATMPNKQMEPTPPGA